MCQASSRAYAFSCAFAICLLGCPQASEVSCHILSLGLTELKPLLFFQRADSLHKSRAGTARHLQVQSQGLAVKGDGEIVSTVAEVEVGIGGVLRLWEVGLALCHGRQWWERLSSGKVVAVAKKVLGAV